MKSAQVKEHIRSYVVDRLLGGDASELSDDTDLLETGILDSFTVLELTAYLQERFSKRLQMNRITAADCKTVQTITRLVEEALAKDNAAQST